MSLEVQIVIITLLFCALIIFQMVCKKYFKQTAIVIFIICVVMLLITRQWKVFLMNLLAGPAVFVLGIGRASGRRAMLEEYTLGQAVIMMSLDIEFFMMMLSVLCSINGVKINI